MVLLKYATDTLTEGLSLQDIQRELFDDARAVLDASRVLPGGGAAVARLLENNGAISYEEYVQTVGKEGTAKLLLEENLSYTRSYHHFSIYRHGLGVGWVTTCTCPLG